MVAKLDKIFDSFVKNRLFKDKSILQISHTPNNITHRDEQIEEVAAILAPALTGEKASNLFLFGKTGTGKTLCVKYVCDEMLKRVKQDGQDNLKFVYINCKMGKAADTEYRILAEIIKGLGGSVPITGLPTGSVYDKFKELVDERKQMIVIILDEIDQAVKKNSDSFLYSLTRVNSDLKNSQISLIGISNSLVFKDYLDPRVRSSLGEEELVFPSYNALQLQDILKNRAENSFKEGALDEDVIPKCAAFAAREHGDARRALDLLRVAGEVAEREGSKKVIQGHIDKANDKLEKDNMLEAIKKQPIQFQLVLYSIMKLYSSKNKSSFFTGDVFREYENLCSETKNDVLTQRRVSDIIQEFDMLGLINTEVISKGRQGRTREIKLMISKKIFSNAEGILRDSLNI